MNSIENCLKVEYPYNKGGTNRWLNMMMHEYNIIGGIYEKS